MLRPLLLAALFAASANAQTADPQNADPQTADPQTADPQTTDPQAIVVTGNRPDRDTALKQATEFVRSGVALPEDGQYARWLDPVCVRVTGVAPPYATIVRDRITVLAREAKVPVASLTCKPNLIVAFVPDAKTLAADLRSGRTSLLASARPEERAAILTGALPVRWFYGVVAGYGGHRQTLDGPNNVRLANGEGGSGIAFGGAPANRRYTSSLITTDVRVGIASAVVIVDLKLAEGVPLVSVADYVALVSLAQLRLPGRTPAYPSILDLFTRPDRGTVAWELSPYDRAFLRALYAIPIDRAGRLQRSLIAARMTRELTAAP